MVSILLIAMYVSGLVVPSCLYLCNQCGALWVQMYPVCTQWTTPLILLNLLLSLINSSTVFALKCI